MVTIQTGNVNFPNHSLSIAALILDNGKENHLYRYAPQGKSDSLSNPSFKVEKGTTLPARSGVDGREGGFWGQSMLSLVDGKPVIINIKASLSSAGNHKHVSTYIVVRQGCEVGTCNINIVPTQNGEQMSLDSMMFINGGFEFVNSEDIKTIYGLTLDPFKLMAAKNDISKVLTHTVIQEARVPPPKIVEKEITDQHGKKVKVKGIGSASIRGRRQVVR